MAPVAGYIAQVTFQDSSGLPRDVNENVFHFAEFDASAANLAGANQVVQRLADFYVGPEGDTGTSVASFLSGELESLVGVKVYDLGAASPRPILYQDSFTIPAYAGGLDMPPEVALCLSYFSTVNVKRQRGRIYVGPFSINTSTASGTYTAPSAALVAAMVAAGQRLSVNTGSCAQGSTTLLPSTPATGTVKVIWSVFSSLGSGTIAAPAPELYAIDNGWVDNEWDSQRRRRIAATSRSTWAPA